MQIDILSLFPSVFGSYLNETPFHYAIQQGIVQVRTHNFCQWVEADQVLATPQETRRGQTMVIRPEPVAACIESLRTAGQETRIVLLSPRGRSLDQDTACDLSRVEHLILICGRLGGFEDGLAELVGAEELSVGDYVLNCGEVAAMVVLDTVVRLLPGVIEPRERPEDRSEITVGKATITASVRNTHS